MRPARTRAGSARSQARVSVPVVCGLPRARLRRWDLNRCGVPGRSRTCDPRFRKPVLYPAELRGRVGLRGCSRAPSFAQPCAAVMRRPRHCTPPRDGAAQPRVCVRRPLPPARAANSASWGIRIDTSVSLLTTRVRPRPSVGTAGTHTIHAHIWRGVPRLPNRIPRSVAFRAPSATAQRYGSRRWPSSSSTSAATTARTSGRIPSGGR
jgi:hypothetical protein